MKNEWKEYNLEEYGLVSSWDDAFAFLKKKIPEDKAAHVGCLVIVHGYGSSGKGGVIREKARQWLNAQVRNGKIRAVVAGEEFDMFNETARKVRDACPELALYMDKGNHGITVVQL